MACLLSTILTTRVRSERRYSIPRSIVVSHHAFRCLLRPNLAILLDVDVIVGLEGADLVIWKLDPEKRSDGVSVNDK